MLNDVKIFTFLSKLPAEYQQTHSGVFNKSTNTPGTAGGPGGRARMLAVQSQKNARKSVFYRKKIKIAKKIILSISSSYATILGETNTPGTAGGPGGRDRTLAVKSRKIV